MNLEGARFDVINRIYHQNVTELAKWAEVLLDLDYYCSNKQHKTTGVTPGIFWRTLIGDIYQTLSPAPAALCEFFENVYLTKYLITSISPTKEATQSRTQLLSCQEYLQGMRSVWKFFGSKMLI